MLIVSYDISDTKLRTRLAKYLSRFGHRIQYSIFEVKHTERFLKNLELEIKGKFEKKFSETDSVMIFNLSQQCKITRYGYAIHDNEELIMIQ